MTEPTPNDERELELATSRELPASNGGSVSNSASISSSISATRQDWLALGAAAEQLGRDGLSEARLLASLQSELIASPAAKVVATQPDATARRTIDWSWVAVGIAASALIGATILGVLRQQSQPLPQQPQLAQPQTPRPKSLDQSPVRPAPVQVAESPVEPSATDSTTDVSSWDDVDEAISSTYTALQKMTSENRGVDRSLTDFDSQLKQLSESLHGESL